MIRRTGPSHLRLVRRDGEAASPCADCQARDLAVCGALDLTGLAQLAAVLETFTFSPGDVLAEEGETANHVFSITQGCVRLSKLLLDGRRQIVGFLHPGDLFGLSTADRHGVTAEAVGPVTACRFRRSDYHRLVETTPGLQTALLERATEDLDEAHEHVLALGRKNAAERLAGFLVGLARASRRAGGDGLALDLPMTRGEIADYLGLTTETVSRLFTRLKEDGLIRLEGLHGVSLLRPAEVEAMAAGAGEA